MGKIEKLVLLSVLCAAAVILAFSLNRKTDEAEAKSPLGASQQIIDRDKEHGLPETTFTPPGGSAPSGEAAAATAELKPGPKSGDSSLLLNAGQELAEGPDAAAKSPALSFEPISDPNHRILADTTGLRPSFVDDYMVYIVAANDTWSSLAQRFYGDGRYTRNLHQANESFGDLKPGDQLMVPVFDFFERDAGLEREPVDLASLAVSSANGTAPPSTPPAGSGTKPADAAPGGTQPLVYEVKAGDTLSDISLAVFGSASRWKEILDANKDVLQKPEALQVGMKLKIPPGGKLPAAAPAKKTDPKAKTAEAPAKKTDPKKKKVL